LGDLQVTLFQQEHYLENFVQSTFDALPENSLTGDSHPCCSAAALCNIYLIINLPPFPFLGSARDVSPGFALQEAQW